MRRLSGIEQQVRIRVCLLPPERRAFLAAVSGGPDSMALLDLLHRFGGGRIEAAHVDYRLRGRESAADRKLVERWCSHLSVPLHVLRLSDAQVRWLAGGDLQRKARELRYEFFRDLLERRSLDWIATGHNRQDRVETFFLRLLRGGGVTALAGMRPVDEQSRLLRPLLDSSRDDIERHLSREGIPSRNDSSNRLPVYARNQVRLELLPWIDRRFGPPGFAGVLRSMEILEAEDAFVSAAAATAAAQLVRPSARGARLGLKGLRALPQALQRRVFLTAALLALGGDPGELGLTHVDSALALAECSRPGKRLAFAGLEVLRGRTWLILRAQISIDSTPPDP